MWRELFFVLSKNNEGNNPHKNQNEIPKIRKVPI
jgi:hypothetical protein